MWSSDHRQQLQQQHKPDVNSAEKIENDADDYSELQTTGNDSPVYTQLQNTGADTGTDNLYENAHTSSRSVDESCGNSAKADFRSLEPLCIHVYELYNWIWTNV